MPARQKGSLMNPRELGILIDYQTRQGHEGKRMSRQKKKYSGNVFKKSIFLNHPVEAYFLEKKKNISRPA